MRLDCKVVEDLLPLYLDDVCSDETKKIVEEHLMECEACQKLINSARDIEMPQVAPDKLVSDKVVKKGFQKIRMRWWISVLVAMILVPAVILSWNQYQGHGISFTNIYELQIGNAFMKCINEGSYEKAYEYVDIAGLKAEWLESWFDEEKLENIEEDGLEIFCEYGEKLEQYGGIENYEYVGISLSGAEEDGTPVYQIVFKVKYAGEEDLFDIVVSNDGVEYFGGSRSFKTDPLARFSIWSEYLWQDYEGCYFDPELNEYIYIAF